MRIQFASDLHLDTRPKQTFETILEPTAPILALLGDIASLGFPSLRPFLEWCSERWETILYVPGNLELIESGEPWAKALYSLRGICSSYKNIHVLYRDVFHSTDGLVVLGCTFWCCIPSVPKEHRARHREDVDWVAKTVKKFQNPYMVLSYYGPTAWVQNETHVEEPGRVPIIPELEMLLRKPVIAWLFGHVHSFLEYSKVWNTANGTARSVLLLCNGLGEKKALKNTEFRKDAVLALSPQLYFADG
jgi:hypothetical protein